MTLTKEKLVALYSLYKEHHFEKVIQQGEALLEKYPNDITLMKILSASNISIHKKWLSIVLKSENELLDGSSINKAISLAKTHSIDTFLINCTTVDILQGALKYVKSNWNKDWGVYPNVGKNMPEKDGFIKHKHNNKEKRFIIIKNKKIYDWNRQTSNQR